MRLTRTPFQDLVKQRDLTFGRALPIELLGIAAGCGAGERRREKFAHRGGEPARA